MAEMEVYHEQKIQDVKMLIGDYLGGEIALYEQVCGFLFCFWKTILPSPSFLWITSNLLD
jgi:enterochelin esterase-like enzyme